MDSSAFSMNLLKHHGLYLKKAVRSWAEAGTLPENQELNKIGSSQMDLYLGALETDQIFHELSVKLQNKNIHSRNDFIHWLSPKDYRILNCSDESRWILRLKRENPAVFIHLHPARHSPFSVRIKATTLKTTLLAAAWFRIHHQLPDKETLNQLREQKLSLSPSVSLSWHQQVLEFFIF